MEKRTLISSRSAEDEAIATMAESGVQKRKEDEQAKLKADEALDEARRASQEGGE